MNRIRISILLCVVILAGLTQASRAALITDPNDPRTWQGATVGTFAALYYGADTAANRQLVVDNQLLDDGVFDPSGFTSATLLATPWSTGGGGGCLGVSTDLTGTGDFDYACTGAGVFDHANTIDNTWFQTGNNPGDTVFDLGQLSSFAAVFPVIDHGPLPQEAIESTVYLSNAPDGPWTQASVRRVFLEGWNPNLGILWDGFTYVVGTPDNSPFRYATLIHGGPGALQNDGDDEINGMLGLNAAPEPASLALLGFGALALFRRRR